MAAAMTRLAPLTQSIPAAQALATLHVDLDALVANWRLLAARAAPAECAAVIKADAYGVGIAPAAQALAAAGCRTFFVAHLSEALRVRETVGPGLTIYVLNGILDDTETLAALAHDDIRPVIASQEQLRLWTSYHPRHGARPACAVQIDTGMNRFGLSVIQAETLAEKIRDVSPALVMTHFVSSEYRDDPLNERQIERFERATARLPGIARSMANSSAIFLPQRPFYDLVRPGYALYGGNPFPDQPNPMRPVVRLSAPILQIRDIEAGETVGYNAQWTAKRRSRLAVIGVGYADGIPRNAMATEAQAGGEALVLGTRCPFAGRVSMDIIVLDVTDVTDPALAPGVEAELLNDVITVDDLASRSKTIGYEILTSLGRRYHRIYAPLTSAPPRHQT